MCPYFTNAQSILHTTLYPTLTLIPPLHVPLFIQGLWLYRHLPGLSSVSVCVIPFGWLRPKDVGLDTNQPNQIMDRIRCCIPSVYMPYPRPRKGTVQPTKATQKLQETSSKSSVLLVLFYHSIYLFILLGLYRSYNISASNWMSFEMAFVKKCLEAI
jgi:hypothetical protein